MKNSALSGACIVILVVLLGWHEMAAAGICAPVLKWQHGGCYSSWCETGWYSSPAVADLDGDGRMEVIGSAYSIVSLDGATGTLIWRAKSGHDRSEPNAGNVGRTWPGVVVADLDGDCDLEIVTAHSGGYVSVYNHEGYFEPGWPRHPATNEFRSLAVADLDEDGDMETVVGQAKLDRVNTWVFEHTGALRSGWPQLSNDEGSAAGLYNDNICLGNLDGDGKLEIVVPSDTITICAYKPDGTHLETHEMYHDHSGHDMDYWGEVPAYVNLEYETRGWGGGLVTQRVQPEPILLTDLPTSWTWTETASMKLWSLAMFTIATPARTPTSIMAHTSLTQTAVVLTPADLTGLNCRLTQERL